MRYSERLARIEARIPKPKDACGRLRAYLDTLPVAVLQAVVRGATSPVIDAIMAHLLALERGEQPEAPTIPASLHLPKVPFEERMAADRAEYQEARRREALDRESAVLQELYAIARESAEREGPA